MVFGATKFWQKRTDDFSKDSRQAVDFEHGVKMDISIEIQEIRDEGLSAYHF